MKYAYIESRPDNFYIREIISHELTPIEKYYGKEFASHCAEVEDDVEEGMIYDGTTKSFYYPQNQEQGKNNLVKEISETINDV